mgnify:FL=1|tara:strand:+ start:1587 stop:1808 length:222 start_codon:yes stop_codon:yes gene_type:complete
MTFKNQTAVNEAIDRYVEHFQRDDVTIFEMSYEDDVTRQFVEIVNQAINSDTRLDLDDLIERIGLDVPDDVLV